MSTRVYVAKQFLIKFAHQPGEMSLLAEYSLTHFVDRRGFNFKRNRGIPHNGSVNRLNLFGIAVDCQPDLSTHNNLPEKSSCGTGFHFTEILPIFRAAGQTEKCTAGIQVMPKPATVPRKARRNRQIKLRFSDKSIELPSILCVSFIRRFYSSMGLIWQTIKPNNSCSKESPPRKQGSRIRPASYSRKPSSATRATRRPGCG